jgi:hypothetical protein
LTPPYNTVQLTATPVNALGEPINNAGLVTFTAADSIVNVDSTGLVTANFRTAGLTSLTRIIASLRYQNVTLADTVAIQVTATAPSSPLATFTLQPAAGDGTRCNINITHLSENCGSVITTALDEAGDTLMSATKATLVVAYASSHPLLATIDRAGTITELDTGHVTFSASTWAYGVAMRDSLPYIIDWPLFDFTYIVQTTNNLLPTLGLKKPGMTIVAGGNIGWLNPIDQKIDIVFDDSTSVSSGCFLICGLLPPMGGGNIPPFYTDTTHTDTSAYAGGITARLFPVAGTYHYHSRIFPSTRGVIYVKEPITP